MRTTALAKVASLACIVVAGSLVFELGGVPLVTVIEDTNAAYGVYLRAAVAVVLGALTGLLVVECRAVRKDGH